MCELMEKPLTFLNFISSVGVEGNAFILIEIVGLCNVVILKEYLF